MVENGAVRFGFYKHLTGRGLLNNCRGQDHVGTDERGVKN